MDAFTIFFKTNLTVAEIGSAVAQTGLEVAQSGAEEMSVSGGSAQVWIYFYSGSDLSSPDFVDRTEWPLQPQEVGAVLRIEVRRNEESTLLAMKLAHMVVARWRGLIAWDGMRSWERLYRDLYPGADIALDND